MRHLALAVLIAASTLAPSQIATGQTRPTPDHRAQADSSKIQPEYKQHVQADVSVVSTPKRDKYDKAGFWINVCLVVVGFGAVVAAARTLGQIKEQANEMKLQRVAMEETLTAIKRQADMMENAERGRITVTGDRLGDLSFVFTAKNIGKTSARVTYARGFSAFVDHGKSLPEEPIYLSNDPIGYEPIQWVGAGDTLDLVRQQADGTCKPMLIGDLSEPSTRNNIRLHGHSLWIFGRILYFDGISPLERDFRFCYGMRVGDKDETLYYSGGPDAYRMEG
jgi:hypothetical protein